MVCNGFELKPSDPRPGLVTYNEASYALKPINRNAPVPCKRHACKPPPKALSSSGAEEFVLIFFVIAVAAGLGAVLCDHTGTGSKKTDEIKTAVEAFFKVFNFVCILDLKVYKIT